MSVMLIVVAIGGNALLRRGEPLTAQVQLANVRSVAAMLADVAREHRLVITHGNGPQVGLLALQSEALGEIPSYPLDVLGAESAGMIGYMIEQGLGGHLEGRPIATLLTMVEVDPDDPAFETPSKPIGPSFGPVRARELIASRGWSMRPEGDGYRRLVASPDPLRIVEMDTIRMLVEAGV
ncbi:MAG: carbamate kinase, partial [Acidobacteriota bacterium]|nr:carbamate kinase [Acidobacteriota bacterium]